MEKPHRYPRSAVDKSSFVRLLPSKTPCRPSATVVYRSGVESFHLALTAKEKASSPTTAVRAARRATQPGHVSSVCSLLSVSVSRSPAICLLETWDGQNYPGGDVNAWSGLHILNEGNTPTFEVYRGARFFKSVVDVTACSPALLNRAEEWQVVRDLTSSDHNAVTFAVRMEGRSGPQSLTGTRVYNTTKARWYEFGAAMDAPVTERALTVEMSPELELLKKDARTKKRRIHNAASSRPEPVVGEYVQAKEIYERAAAKAQTASWKRFYSVRTSWRPSWRKPSSLMTGSIMTIRIMRKATDGDDQPPVTSGDLSGVDPPFTGIEVKNALKAFHPRKVPDIDAFTSDICQAAIFRDL
ncbi:hypothetical protein EVAR_76664_1 [Eumeta japonica]|uniref:Endonuclease/exonuclease/phosphatase domain-containing protein n=1 Tax=Eumeta variegata TaxID=151549 RepID=A0A4C1YH68_EUMVA|nr:hypothetical protein EVAR_76664_1 [Eumeta japonica]